METAATALATATTAENAVPAPEPIPEPAPAPKPTLIDMNFSYLCSKRDNLRGSLRSVENSLQYMTDKIIANNKEDVWAHDSLSKLLFIPNAFEKDSIDYIMFKYNARKDTWRIKVYDKDDNWLSLTFQHNRLTFREGGRVGHVVTKGSKWLYLFELSFRKIKMVLFMLSLAKYLFPGMKMKAYDTLVEEGKNMLKKHGVKHALLEERGSESEEDVLGDDFINDSESDDGSDPEFDGEPNKRYDRTLDDIIKEESDDEAYNDSETEFNDKQQRKKQKVDTETLATNSERPMSHLFTEKVVFHTENSTVVAELPDSASTLLMHYMIATHKDQESDTRDHV